MHVGLVVAIALCAMMSIRASQLLYAGCLHDFQPHLVLLVDAAQMNQPPGAIALLACEAIAGISASTHTLPLDVLAHFLTLDSGCEVALLGIQPETTALGAALSPAVERAVDEAARALEQALGQTG